MSDGEKTTIDTTGETVPACDHQLKKTGPHWTCMLCGEQARFGSNPGPAPAPSPSPLVAPPPSAADTERPPEAEPPGDAFAGIGENSSEEDDAKAQRFIANTLGRHEKANRERAEEGYDNRVDEHLDKGKRVVSLFADLLSGGD